MGTCLRRWCRNPRSGVAGDSKDRREEALEALRRAPVGTIYRVIRFLDEDQVQDEDEDWEQDRFFRRVRYDLGSDLWEEVFPAVTDDGLRYLVPEGCGGSDILFAVEREAYQTPTQVVALTSCAKDAQMIAKRLEQDPAWRARFPDLAEMGWEAYQRVKVHPVLRGSEVKAGYPLERGLILKEV